MYRILTRPVWESRVPAGFRRNGERYWTIVEVPIDDEWTFLVNVAANASRQSSARTLLVVSFEKLLEIIGDLNADVVSSVYHLNEERSESGSRLSVHQLSEILVANDSRKGWRKVFFIRSTEGTIIGNSDEIDAIHLMKNWTQIAKLADWPADE